MTRFESTEDPIDIGSRWEIFADRLLISQLDKVELRLNEPQLAAPAESPLPGTYTTVIKDGDLFRAFYRDYRAGSGYENNAVIRKSSASSDSPPVTTETPVSERWIPRNELVEKAAAEITCYAESSDGREWVFPDLGVHPEAPSKRGNNAVLVGANPCCHNFAPFLDLRPGVPERERFKALTGTLTCGRGLHALASPDGLHWSRMHEGPVFPGEQLRPDPDRPGSPGLDSHNVVFWSSAEGLYVCYLRTMVTRHGPLRTISRITSEDFLRWSDPIPMECNLPGEHLYTSQTHPYFRTPHIYVALPTRYFWDRGHSTDIMFMSTRAGSEHYDRTFPEALIRPGLDPAAWANRANYAAQNVVPTGPAEMSVYNCGKNSGERYVLRTDGFTSVRSGAESGCFLTRPLLFSGRTLSLNLRTSAGGNVRVEIQNPEGEPIPGYTLEDSIPFVGNSIKAVMSWKNGPELGGLSGSPVRLRFSLTECDLYGLGFDGSL